MRQKFHHVVADSRNDDNDDANNAEPNFQTKGMGIRRQDRARLQRQVGRLL